MRAASAWTQKPLIKCVLARCIAHIFFSHKTTNVSGRFMTPTFILNSSARKEELIYKIVCIDK